MQISVWHEPDLSVFVVVRPDGMITLPLVNDVAVMGLTPKELQSLLVDKLKGLVAEPTVTINVVGVPSRKFYLLGQVARQDVFPLAEHETVLRAIVEAGGLTPYARLGSIYVLRQSGSHVERLPFNFKKALRGDNTGDIELLPGDTIVVP